MKKWLTADDRECCWGNGNMRHRECSASPIFSLICLPLQSLQNRSLVDDHWETPTITIVFLEAPISYGTKSGLINVRLIISLWLMDFFLSAVDLQCINFCCTKKWYSYTYIHILFCILFHYGLSQDSEYSSLCIQ